MPVFTSEGVLTLLSGAQLSCSVIMESRVCMNTQCGASTSKEWRKGWALRSGNFVTLCDKCGSAYDQSVFCEVYHSKESGWRDCTSCSQRLHCGCIVSRFLIEILDGGGVNCINCAKKSGLAPIAIDDQPNGFGLLKVDNACALQATATDGHPGGGCVDKINLLQLSSNAEKVALKHSLQFQNDDQERSFAQMKQEEVLHPSRETGTTCFSNFHEMSNGISQAAKPDINSASTGPRDIYKSLAQTNLSITLSTPENPSHLNSIVVDERGKMLSTFQQVPRSRHLLPKPPKSTIGAGLEANSSMVSPIRVARPPAEGRGRNQLLPRYWPRITDQELQQLSGDSNSTIVPLFEKVLSASDAGRIGRLVLPKACAEAYFPPISQPEGLPLRIQDIKGKEWVFQFRFWPNNNSRMYVLEGVTPCIQSMQLQAGDTVTFSRMDPEGKLVMGFRKATNSMTVQDTQPSAIPSVNHSSESFFSGVFENLPIISGYSGLLQSLKGSADTHLSTLSKHLNSANVDVSWHKPEKHEDMTRESVLLPSMLIPERKRTRNIGSKSKRLLIDSLDSLELKLTWEEAQDLLRPPPSSKPSIVTIEDHDFEEYEEPPVFGKRSIFVVRSTGAQEQWAQCDSCSKWRRLPIDILLPPKWRCSDNNWDQSRSSCSALDELTPSEQENLLRLSKDFKRRRMTVSHRHRPERESSGLDALANAAILGDNVGEPGTTSVATTTKHPRHRPGCSCIVCIQPPSGKGKHKPTCTCNVCMTVKRRFKTLMMRKKKRQSEREAEIVQRNRRAWAVKEEAEVDSTSKHVLSQHDPSESEARSANEESNKVMESGKGEIDLNCHPDREENSRAALTGVSMMSLVQVASLPLETYLKQNGYTSLISEQHACSTSQIQPQATGESEGQGDENRDFASAGEERENGDEENCGGKGDEIESGGP